MSLNLLWLVGYLPDSIHHGGVLRLVNLARALKPVASSRLAVLYRAGQALDSLRSLDIFDDILAFDPPTTRPRWLRHLRISNTHVTRQTFPDHYKSLVRDLCRYVAENDIDIGISFSWQPAEILENLPCRLRAVDDYDCRTLTLERLAAAEPVSLLSRQRISRFVHYWRTRNMEHSLSSRFDLVTTISATDQARLRGISRSHKDLVVVLKNGVDEALLEFSDYSGEEPNAVVFWGNLSFRPNRHAVHYFVEQIYRPYLRDRGIRCHIVGPNADESIRSLGRVDEGIVVAGFVSNLAAYVTRFPVMINPLISGSGLKNKLLEAFALRRAVVSTPMGAEAIEAIPSEHYLQAASPEEFANHVLSCLGDETLRRRLTDAAYSFVSSNYRWSVIGRRLEDLLVSRLPSTALLAASR